MKTIKINDETHQKLIELQAYNYKEDGTKLTISQTIESLLIFLDTLTKRPTKAKNVYKNDTKNNNTR